MTNYEYGFITKCAEYGVDPDKLIKVAGIGSWLGNSWLGRTATGLAMTNPVATGIGLAAGGAALGAHAMNTVGGFNNDRNFEDDIEARAAQHAKDLGLNRYDPNNKAGTMLSRGWNKLIKSREGYEDWYASTKEKEMNEHIARTNKINQFGSGFNKVHDVYSAKPGNGAANPAQTSTPNPGNSQRTNPAISTARSSMPTTGQQAQQTQQAQRPQPPQISQTAQIAEKPPIRRGHQGGTSWNGIS